MTDGGADPRTLCDPRYTLERLLGRGGMGEVWLAQDHEIDREVAIKVMRPDAARSPEAVARFLREARVQGRLDHPAIPPVHDLGDDPAAPYFAMKRLAGTTLADVLAARAAGDELAREGWPRRMLLARFVDVCLAVELAHQRGVIHRDLKPANIMLGELGETYVLDWGLARAGEGEEGAIEAGDLGPSTDLVTLAGQRLGTPGYMSPEQLRGEPVDARTDVYALGCVLFEILAGQRAALGDDAAAVDGFRPSERRAVAGDELVSPELDDACVAATRADAGTRLASARALADRVQRYLDGDRDLARRRELAADHAARAAAHWAQHGDRDRADAMREAGRAIALDPTCESAKQLLVRLLLEPPREVPDAVRREIVRDRVVATQSVLRTAAYSYVCNLLLLLVCKLLGFTGGWPFATIGALLAIQIVVCAAGARRTRPLDTLQTALLLGMHALVITVASASFGPLLAGTIFVLGGLPILLMFPSVYLPKTVFALHAAALGLPLLLEVLGVLPSTISFAGGAIVVKPALVSVPPQVLLGVVLVGIVVQMVISLLVFPSQRLAQERAQERVHVTAWHLRQLVE